MHLRKGTLVKSYLLLIGIYLFVAGQAFAQNCPATITPSNPAPVCAPTTILLTANSVGLTYQWQRNGANIGGTTRNNTYNATQSGTYTVIVGDPNGGTCGAVTSPPVTVTIYPRPSFTYGETRVNNSNCIPVDIDLTPEPEGNLTYLWRVLDDNGQNLNPSVYEFLAPGTNTSQRPVIRFKEQGRFTVRMVVNRNCGGRDSVSQSIVIAYPEVELTLGGPFCGKDTEIDFASDNRVRYDRNLGTLRTYRWVIRPPRGSNIILTNAFPIINFSEIGTYHIEVYATNECGSTADVRQLAATGSITINEIPPPPTIPPIRPICRNGSTTITPNGPGPFRFYTALVGGTRVGNEVPNFSFTARANDTTFYVSALSPQGCESTRVPVFIEVREPISNNTISPLSQTICSGSMRGLITGSDAREESTIITQYQWQVSTVNASSGFTPINGATGKNLSPEVITVTETTTYWYRRVATSATGCDDTSNTVEVQVFQSIPAGANTIRVPNVPANTPAYACAGGNAPVITGIDLTANIPGVQYSWERSNSATGTFQTITSATGADFDPGILPAGTYFFRRVAISGANGTGNCRQVSNAIELQVTAQLGNNNIQGAQTICGAPSPITLTGTALSNVRYRWESSPTGAAGTYSSAPGTNTTQNYTPPLTALTQTTYFRRVIEPITGACPPNTSDHVLVTVIPAITNNTILIPNTVVCQGTTSIITASDPMGGNGALEFQWQRKTSSMPDFVSITGATARDYRPDPTNVEVRYRRLVRSAGSNCPASMSGEILISVETAPPAPTVETPIAITCQGVPTTLRATSNDATFAWYNLATGGNPLFIGREFVTPDNLTTSTTFYVEAISANQCRSLTRTAVRVNLAAAVANAGRDTTLLAGQGTPLKASGGVTYAWSPATGLSSTTVANPVARPTETTTYTVLVTDMNGCTALDEVTITVIPRVQIFNTFSPNGDRFNEVWEIGNIANFPEATVEIFNRWGHLVFKSNGYKEPWDGTQNGKPLPLDTYYYIIRLKKDENPLKGSVTIIR